MKVINVIDTPYQADPNNFVISQPTNVGASIGLLDEAGKTITASEADKKTPLAFTRITQKGISFKNRFVVSPMCTYSAQDGFLNDFHVAHYGGFSLNAPGAVVVEATAVQKEGRISIFCSGLWSDEHIESHRRVAGIIKRHGVAAGIQIGHAGRKASTLPLWMEHSTVAGKDIGGWEDEVYGPSDIPFEEKSAVPKAMTREQIQETINAFADTAVRADKAGYDFLEIHGAHGYLISSFFSPYANNRTDEYGGSFENRTRLLVEIVQKIKAVWPANKPIWVRISCSEWVENGWDIDESVKLSAILKDLGVDLIDCSSGGINADQQIPFTVPNFQLPFADRIRKEVGIQTGAVGGISEAKQAESILQEGKADFVLSARKFLNDSSFVKRAAVELGVDLRWPLQHERGKDNRKKSN